jgi:hypothetical protein
LPGFISTLWMIVPTGMTASGIALPGFTSTCSQPDTTVSPTSGAAAPECRTGAVVAI